MAVSGCVSNNGNNSTTKESFDDLYIDGAPLIENVTKDENGNTVGGGYVGDTSVMISIRSKSGKAYSNIQANVTSYDANNQVVASKIYTVPYLEAGYGQTISFESKKAIDHVTMTVVNATMDK
ncbi:MAG: hypothetical protein K8E24_014605 [Methanobacterium paludis]|nr:hypothetical protein [Methanobacterium paludis]